jgi:fluoride exporter
LALNPPPRSLGLAFAGGAVGTIARALVTLVAGNFFGLFVVNLVGAGFLGWVNGSSQAPNPKFASAEKKWFWGAGFSGGFTTMSGLALIFVLLSGGFGVIPALIYILVQFAAGLFCYALGFRLSKGEWPSV